MSNKNPNIVYEPEADVLRVEISKTPIDYAREMGNFVVHFNRKGMPAYLEILEARRFLLRSEKAFEKAGLPVLAKA